MSCSVRSSVLPQSDSLIELAIKGDAAALDQLFVPYLPQLRRTAASLLDNPYDCEDALQNGLLSAFRHVSKFEGRAKFSTWMQAIVINAAKSILRKKKRQPTTLSLDEPLSEHKGLHLSDTLCDPRVALEEDYGRFEQSQILGMLLQEIPPAFRSVIWLCDVEGLCMKEAAEFLGLSIPAIKTRHLRAKRLILKLAKEVCPQTSDLGKFRQPSEQPSGAPRSWKAGKSGSSRNCSVSKIRRARLR